MILPPVVALLALALGTVPATLEDDPVPVHAGTESEVQLHAPGDRDGFSVVLFGDRTGSDRSEYAVMDEGIRMANRLDPDFVMTVGDLVEGYCDGDTWLREVREFQEHISHLEVPWYPVAGNHDVYGGRDNKEQGNLALYKRHVGPLYYSFDHRWAHFIVLFSDESLSFSDYARDQNLSQKQLDWLRADLARTKATQVYVFLHHPRWQYRGSNWPQVHEVLAQDGRTRSIFAGHMHEWVDDGIRDGIHRHIIGSTGGVTGELVESVDAYQIAHLRVRKDDYTLSYLPVGSVHGADLVLREELTEMRRISRVDWARLDRVVGMHHDERTESLILLMVSNPGKKAMDVRLRFDRGGEWTWSHDAPDDLRLEPGELRMVELHVGAPPFDGTPPQIALEVSLHYPLQSGLVQPIRRTLAMPIAFDGATQIARSTPDANRAVRTSKENCLRVPWREEVDAFTIESWVRTSEDEASGVFLGHTQSAGFSLGFDDGAVVGYVRIKELGKYVRPTAPTPLEPNRWYHCALAWDGETARLFVDGALVDEQPAAGTLHRNHRPLFVGADTDGSGDPEYPFAGEVDEVRVSQVARYSVPFTPDARHTADADTLVLLHLDRTFGAGVGPGVLPDASGRGNHAWPVGTPPLVPAER